MNKKLELLKNIIIDKKNSFDIAIGKKLKNKRKKIGMTMSEVGAILNVKQQQIHKYESGQARVSASKLYEFAYIYGEKVTYFYQDCHPENFIYNKDIWSMSSVNIGEANILIVENDPVDEFLIRKVIAEINPKINIFCLHNSEQVMNFLKYQTMYVDFQRPNLIFMDLILPNREGMFLLKELKKDPNISDIPVVFITNCLNIDAMVNVYKNGAAGFIIKSNDKNELKRKLTICFDYWFSAIILPVEKIKT